MPGNLGTTLAALFNLEMCTPNAKLGWIPQLSEWRQGLYTTCGPGVEINRGVNRINPLRAHSDPLVGATRGSSGKGPCHRALNKATRVCCTTPSSHKRPSSQSRSCWRQPPSSTLNEHNVCRRWLDQQVAHPALASFTSSTTTRHGLLSLPSLRRLCPPANSKHSTQ